MQRGFGLLGIVVVGLFALIVGGLAYAAGLAAGQAGAAGAATRNRRLRVRMVASVRLRVRVLLLPPDHVRAVQGDRRSPAMGRLRRVGLRPRWLGSRRPDRPGLRRPRRPAAVRADAPEVAPASPRRSRRRAAGLGFRFGRAAGVSASVDRRRATGESVAGPEQRSGPVRHLWPVRCNDARCN